MDADSARSVISQVSAIKGFDPLRIHDGNVELALYYLPSLQSAYRDLIAAETEKLDLLKVEKKRAEERERLRLLEIRAKGEGPGGVKLDVDSIKFFTTRCGPVLDLDMAIASRSAAISAMWGYVEALGESNKVALSYSGRKREEVKFGFAQHKMSHHFEKVDSIQHQAPKYTNDFSDPYKPTANEFELPDLDDEE